jgi:hypothetical protein
MGMFDSLYVKCPSCGEQVEFQSKRGACGLYRYNIYDVPIEIAVDLKNETQQCDNCKNFVTLKVQTMALIQPVIE